MKKYIPEVDAFEFKAKLIARKLKQFAIDYKKDYMDIKILSDFLAIEPTEMNSMVYYLKRGEFIETDTEKSTLSSPSTAAWSTVITTTGVLLQ